MEIIELIGGLLQAADACVCFFQIAALVLDGSSLFAGYRAVRTGGKRRAQAAEGVPPERNVYKVIFWVLLPLAALSTGLAIFSLIRGWSR